MPQVLGKPCGVRLFRKMRDTFFFFFFLRFQRWKCEVDSAKTPDTPLSSYRSLAITAAFFLGASMLCSCHDVRPPAPSIDPFLVL